MTLLSLPSYFRIFWFIRGNFAFSPPVPSFILRAPLSLRSSPLTSHSVSGRSGRSTFDELGVCWLRRTGKPAHDFNRVCVCHEQQVTSIDFAPYVSLLILYVKSLNGFCLNSKQSYQLYPDPKLTILIKALLMKRCWYQVCCNDCTNWDAPYGLFIFGLVPLHFGLITNLECQSFSWGRKREGEGGAGGEEGRKEN